MSTPPQTPDEIKQEFQRRKDRCAWMLGLATVALAVPPIVEFYWRGKNSLWPLLAGGFLWGGVLLLLPFQLRCPVCGTIDPLTNRFSR